MNEVRRGMLDVLGQFLPSLRSLAYVQRIGLTGSITTPKREPNDIDVVVCIAEGADLTELATVYRKMSGRLQGMGKGVDVFIFENGTYVGRPCHHRECAGDPAVLHRRPLRAQAVPPRRPERDRTLPDDAHEASRPASS